LGHSVFVLLITVYIYSWLISAHFVHRGTCPGWPPASCCHWHWLISANLTNIVWEQTASTYAASEWQMEGNT